MAFIVPPGGFAGFSQMTAASRARLSQIPRNGGGARRKSKRTKGRKRAATGRKRGKSRKMKFGSPAWQRKYKVGKFKK